MEKCISELCEELSEELNLGPTQEVYLKRFLADLDNVTLVNDLEEEECY